MRADLLFLLILSRWSLCISYADFGVVEVHARRPGLGLKETLDSVGGVPRSTHRQLDYILLCSTSTRYMSDYGEYQQDIISERSETCICRPFSGYRPSQTLRICQDFNL